MTAVLVHGSFAADPAAQWAHQRALADRYRLVLPHRLGYGNSRPPAGDDDKSTQTLADDVQAVAAVVNPGTHLVGFSYGGLVVLLVAAARANAVRSLAVIEPPLYGLVRGDVEAEALITRLQPVYATAGARSPDEFYYAFMEGLGQHIDQRVPLTPARRQAVTAAAKEAVPWDVALPLNDVAAAPFPKLVLSGGWNAVNERLCDTLADAIGARRAVIPGAGHGVQRTGQPFNDRIELLWEQATDGR